MNEITQYQKMAGVLAMDIDILAELASKLSHEDLLASVLDLKEQKDQFIEKPETLNRVYAARQLVFGIAARQK